MKFFYLPLLLVLILFTTASAQSQALQDAVYLKNGSIIRGLIMEQIPGNTLKILMADGSLFVYQQSEVEKIVKEVNPGQPGTTAPTTVNSMDKQGRIDASKYYRGYRGAQLSTLFTALFAGPFALGVAIPCAATAPKEETLYTDKHPNPELFNNEEYKKGYADKAHKMKKVKTWVSFGVGFGINAAVMGAAAVARSHNGYYYGY
jgi:hypothetical protein